MASWSIGSIKGVVLGGRNKIKLSRLPNLEGEREHCLIREGILVASILGTLLTLGEKIFMSPLNKKIVWLPKLSYKPAT